MQFSATSNVFDSPEKLLRENEDLKRQLAEADVRLNTVYSVEAENEDLKKAFNRSSYKKYDLAVVLKYPPLVPYDQLILDIGRDMNISTGDNVYAPGNVLIGKISEVVGNTSKVLLLSSPGQKYQVMIGNNHLSAEAIGRGGGQYQAEMPRDSKISKGDFVTVASISDRPFGIVSEIISDQANPFKTVIFAPPVNLYQLRWVLIENNKR